MMAPRSKTFTFDPGIALGWSESGGYALVTLLAVLGGYVTGMLTSPHALSQPGHSWLGLFLFCVGIFALALSAFHIRCILIDRDHKIPADAGSWSWGIDIAIACFGLAMAAWASNVLFNLNVAWSLVPVAICIFWIWGISHDGTSRFCLLAWKRSAADFSSTEEAEFISKVFFPAFSMSSLSFLLGWGVFSGRDDFFRVVLSYCIYLVVCGIACVRFRVSLPRTLLFVSAYPISCSITYSFELFRGTWLEHSFNRPEFAFAAVWTYVMGVFEVSKRPYMLFIKQDAEDPSGNAKGIEFYEGGANWASVTVCHLPLLLVFMVESASIIWFSVCTIVAALSWIFLISNKKSLLARRFSIGAGFAIGTLYILLGLSVLPLAVPSEKFVPMYGTLVTAIVALATIAFVLYPREFLSVGHTFSNGGNFTDVKNSVMLSMINIVVIVSMVLVWAGAINIMYGSVSQLAQFKIDIVLLVCGVEMIGIFLAYLWTQARETVAVAIDESGTP